MVSVRINDEEAPLRSEGLAKLTDLVELVKSTIDPDHMITGILVDGKELEESDWIASMASYETSIVEFETGRPEDYVCVRLVRSPEIVQACFLEFREARKLFQGGKSAEGNKLLLESVQALQAFFEWYGSLIGILDDNQQSRFSIEKEVLELTAVCKTICQQQLYQSWWALGETIHNELEPKIDALETRCRSFQDMALAEAI